MSKVKPKKQSTFIDMTAMSDVTVLLLTFFMLTSTFLPKEPIQVISPSSVSEIKIPEANVFTILIAPSGQVYLNFDRPNDKLAALETVGKDYNINFTDAQKVSFVNQTHIGVPISSLPAFLDMPLSDQDELLKTTTVPTDSTNNQLKRWIEIARRVNENISIAVKSDQSTPYSKIDVVIKTLQEARENRFNLITNLRGMPEGF